MELHHLYLLCCLNSSHPLNTTSVCSLWQVIFNCNMCCCAGDSKGLTRFFSQQITYAGNILCIWSEAFMATEFSITVSIFILQGCQHSFCYGSTDENMDQTMKSINSSSSETDHLIMLLDKHCKAAEHLALETVAGMDMPFLNPARELTKGECWQILVSLVICVSSD